MNDIIHLLPDAVANQIAAGEVVQRPASVVKEMVENAIDAGADNIQVRIVDGGKTCIQIIDNGIGMSETDARMAFERHATSKIADAKDIYALTTMGFRGEALASIAAVAQVELKTRRKEDELGTYLRMEGAKVVEQKNVACPVGSNFEVRNIFFNIPVRRKFLKSTQTELNNIIQDFERIALVYPNVKFQLFHNDVPIFQLDISNVKQRIIDVCGKKYDNLLLPINTTTPLVNVFGFIGKPESAKKKGSRQFFFVNGRYMRHQYFHSAVERAYDNIIPQGLHPDYFIYLDVEPQNIDVNVHPTKTEIKFENEQMIWQVINAAAREAVGKFNEIPTIDFSRSDEDINIPVANHANPIVRMTTPSTSFNPFRQEDYKKNTASYQWEKLYPNTQQNQENPPVEVIVKGALSKQVPQQTSIWKDDDESGGQDYESLNVIQFKDKYILLPTDDAILIIDQHRAHVKILFHRIMERIKNNKKASQGLIFPEIVQLSKIEHLTYEEVKEDLAILGFDLTSLGSDSYQLNGIPAGMEGHDYQKLLHNLLWVAAENKNAVKQTVTDQLALTMAQTTAVPYGQKLTQPEMKEIIAKLRELNFPKRTPDGKNIMANIDMAYIDKIL